MQTLYASVGYSLLFRLPVLGLKAGNQQQKCPALLFTDSRCYLGVICPLMPHMQTCNWLQLDFCILLWYTDSSKSLYYLGMEKRWKGTPCPSVQDGNMVLMKQTRILSHKKGGDRGGRLLGATHWVWSHSGNLLPFSALPSGIFKITLAVSKAGGAGWAQLLGRRLHCVQCWLEFQSHFPTRSSPLICEQCLWLLPGPLARTMRLSRLFVNVWPPYIHQQQWLL